MIDLFGRFARAEGRVPAGSLAGCWDAGTGFPEAAGTFHHALVRLREKHGVAERPVGPHAKTHWPRG